MLSMCHNCLTYSILCRCAYAVCHCAWPLDDDNCPCNYLLCWPVPGYSVSAANVISTNDPSTPTCTGTVAVAMTACRIYANDSRLFWAVHHHSNWPDLVAAAVVVMLVHRSYCTCGHYRIFVAVRCSGGMADSRPRADDCSGSASGSFCWFD